MAWGWGCPSRRSPTDPTPGSTAPGSVSCPSLCRAGWARLRGWAPTSRPSSRGRLPEALPSLLAWLWARFFLSLPRGTVTAF